MGEFESRFLRRADVLPYCGTVAETHDVWVPIEELDCGEVAWDAACEGVAAFVIIY